MDKQKYIEQANRLSGFNAHNGIEVVEFDDEHCTVIGKISEKAMNPFEMAHGGFVYSLCDVAAGVIISREGHPGVTLNSNVHFLHPSRGTVLRAEGRIVKKGRTVSVIKTEVYDDNDRLTAVGTFEIYAL